MTEIENNKKIIELKEIKSFSHIKEHILHQFEEEKMHHAIMLSGNYGIGKATFAYWLVSLMILSECKKNNDSENFKKMHLELLSQKAHPDVFFLKISEGENEIKIEQIRELIEKINLKSTYGNKFIIIDDINSINLNGLNALLKTLEEPLKKTFFIIIDHKTTYLPDTIYSRCNKIKMKLSKEDFTSIVKQLHDNLTLDEIEFYEEISGRSINFTNVLLDLEAKKIIDSELEKNTKISYILNTINNAIDIKHKNFPRILKMNLLERITLFLGKNYINNNLTQDGQVVKQINQLLSQFINIKTFELPIKFV